MSFNHRFIPVIVSLSLATALTLSGCAGGGGGWEMPPPVVNAIRATEKPWTVTYKASGTIEASKKVDLNAEMSGTVTDILVKEGQTVSKGQVLMRLKSDKQLAQKNQAAAGVMVAEKSLNQQVAIIQQAESRVESAKTRFELASAELKRYQELFDQEFISQLDLDQRVSRVTETQAAYQEALQSLESTKSAQKTARASLDQSRSNYRYNQAVLNESVLRAPFSGVIGHHFVKQGDFIAPTEKLMTLVDQSYYEISFPVPERYLQQLKTGMAVSVVPNGQEQLPPLKAKVRFINPVIDSDSHTVSLKASLPYTRRLKHGLFSSVALDLQSLSHVVVLPDEAIVPQGEKNFVYILLPQSKDLTKKDASKTDKTNDDQLIPMVAHQQEVIIENRDGQQAQLKSGLQPGTVIVLSGLQKVSEGLEVKARLKNETTPPARTVPANIKEAH